MFFWRVFFWCMATIGLAAAAPAWSLDNQAQYQACMGLLDRDPAGALDSAVEWERQGGGDAARHCKALALIRTGEVEDGALELERIAETLPQIKAPMAASLFAQAGQAWIKAGKPQRALYAQDQGLKLNPRDVELLVDRA